MIPVSSTPHFGESSNWLLKYSDFPIANCESSQKMGLSTHSRVDDATPATECFRHQPVFQFLLRQSARYPSTAADLKKLQPARRETSIDRKGRPHRPYPPRWPQALQRAPC